MARYCFNCCFQTCVGVLQIRQKRKQTLRKTVAEGGGGNGEGGGISGSTNTPGGGHSHFLPTGGADSDDAVTMTGVEKPRHKNTTDTKLTKRSHVEAQTGVVGGTGSVQKRKFPRKRKISSSNESTTSEAPSNASEVHNPAGSPQGIVHMYSPTTYHPSSGGGISSSKRPALDEGDRIGTATATTTANFSTDCDNLDLLASVTQRVSMHQPSSSSTGRKSRPHPSAVAATANPSFQQHHAGANSTYSPVTAAAGGTGGRKKQASTTGSAKQQKNSP